MNYRIEATVGDQKPLTLAEVAVIFDVPENQLRHPRAPDDWSCIAAFAPTDWPWAIGLALASLITKGPIAAFHDVNWRNFVDFLSFDDAIFKDANGHYKEGVYVLSGDNRSLLPLVTSADQRSAVIRMLTYSLTGCRHTIERENVELVIKAWKGVDAAVKEKKEREKEGQNKGVRTL